uniref:Uncharacterized protein n=1 Tax=Esox lucius TaxID=8010 RepID=A0A6Q2XDG5_ESOLU
WGCFIALMGKMPHFFFTPNLDLFHILNGFPQTLIFHFLTVVFTVSLTFPVDVTFIANPPSMITSWQQPWCTVIPTNFLSQLDGACCCCAHMLALEQIEALLEFSLRQAQQHIVYIEKKRIDEELDLSCTPRMTGTSTLHFHPPHSLVSKTPALPSGYQEKRNIVKALSSYKHTLAKALTPPWCYWVL